MRLRGPQRVLEAGAHEIEDVTVALGELTLGAAEPGDDHLATLRADADRDAVLDAGSVQQVAVQLAAGQAAGLDGLGEAQRRTPTGGMREQERVTRRVAHDRLERAGRLGLGRDRLVTDRARRELDAVPREHIRGDELSEPLSARPRNSVTVRTSAIARANPCAAPTSVSASQGMASQPRRYTRALGRRSSRADTPTRCACDCCHFAATLTTVTGSRGRRNCERQTASSRV